MRPRFVVPVCALSLAACNTLQNDAQRTYSGQLGPTTHLLVTTAAGRVITERANPLAGQPNIICTEPPPDVANAVATLLAAQLSAKSPGGATGSGSLTASSSEAVAELAGRSTALLGLRDGLYKACEAYANGIIGDDAYTLLLTRYGQLMVTLFLGQDIGSAAIQQAKATAPEPASGRPVAGGDSGSSPANGTTGGEGTAAGKSTTFNAPVGPPANPLLHSAVFAMPAVTGAQPPAAKNVPNDQSTNNVTDQQPAKKVTQTPAKTSTPGGTVSAGVSAAQAIATMQQNYFNLSKDSFSMLLVACVNEFDQTRSNIRQGHWNTWLRVLCNQADNIAQLAQMDAAQVVSGLTPAQRLTLLRTLRTTQVLPQGYVFPSGQESSPPQPATIAPATR